MIDHQEADDQAPDPFDAALMEAIPDEAGDVEMEAPTVETSEEVSLDPAPAEAQDSLNGEDPSPSGSSALMRAMDEINRARIPSAILDGKSEDELLAIGKQAALDRAQRDREWHERQTQGRETSAGTAEEEGPAGELDTGGTEESDEAETPFDLDAVRTALVEEYGEEAARPHIQALEAQEAHMKRLEASLEEERQARQLEPLNRKIEEVWEGLAVDRPALSEPETRQKVEVLAQQLHELEPDLYKDKTPEEWIPIVLERAATTILGPLPTPASPRRRSHAQPTAPSARSKDRPLTADERFEAALLEAVPDES